MPSQFDFDELQKERDAALIRAEDAESKNAKFVEHMDGFDSIEARAEAYDEVQAKLEQLSIKYREREKELDLATLNFKSGQYDALLELLRTGLNEAKREQGIYSQSQIAQFAHDVGQMTDIVIMATVLDDMHSSAGKHSEFLKMIIGAGNQTEQDNHNADFLEEQKRRSMAGY